MTKVQIFTRRVYGVVKVYPANEAARRFTMMTRRATITTEDLNHIRALGFEIQQVLAPDEVQEMLDQARVEAPIL